jgi:riboflavin kinase/FMN adenylyltransferase
MPSNIPTDSPFLARNESFVHWHGEGDVPAPLQGAVVAIGNFDGLHRGHRAIVAATVALAREHAAPAALLTFEPHPRRFFAPDKPLFRITPAQVKALVAARLGLAGMIELQFDAALAATSAHDFIEQLLVERLGAKGVVVGHDFHFGKGRQGTPAFLSEHGAALGLAVRVLPAVTEGGEVVSSSAIRASLAAGDIARANHLLGYRWLVQADVRHGDKRGRDLGYPTANLALDPECGLRHGIYAVRAAVDGTVHTGVASFGRRPTFDNGAPLLEVHLFDFRGDLYGRTMNVEFVAFLRPEERFASVEALVAQMDRDSAEARRLLQEGISGVPSLLDSPQSF